MPLKPHWEEDEEVLVEDDVSSDLPARIIVFNDDHNTFEWVIQCFMEILQYGSEQAEQLSMMIHFKGKAIVKTGPRDKLKPLCEALLDRGLSAEMDEGE